MGGQVRKLNSDSVVEDELSQNGTLSGELDLIASKNVTEAPEPISFKKLKNAKTKNKKQKIPKKKARINREILTTLLSRKKLYKILAHKLDM